MSAATLATILPQPKHTSIEDDDVSNGASNGIGSSSGGGSLALTSKRSSHIPPYGKRRGWKPRKQEDFGDGGAYPECHIAQYPLDMGRKRSGPSGSTVSLQVDEDGNVQYDAVVKQGLKNGQTMQTQHKDLVPLRDRTDVKDKSMERPDESEVMSTTERTRLALEKITQSKISGKKTSLITQQGGGSSFVRYTPGQQGDGSKQRIIKMTEQINDPLEPSGWRFKKIPKGPPSPPPPVLRSPPRKISAQDQKDWMIPPCISNWKNNKGYTIPLDKRLAADGRGLQDVYINDGFAQFSEALNLADRHAREEVRLRSQMQQKLAAKEKAAREEHLRQLAQRAREERAGIVSATPTSVAGGSEGPGRSVAATGGGSMPAALAGYGSGSEDESGSESEDEQDEEAARERDRMRQERRREREREIRMTHMGTEQRAKVLAREQNRDISEKVALGLAKPTASTEMDQRLFNQEKLSGTFGDDESYGHFDKPLFAGSSAAAAMYKRPKGTGTADDIYAGGTAEGVEEAMKNDRFGLGKSRFEGAELQEPRTGPVQFEKDTSDPFSINQFLDDAKRGTKRSGLESTDESRKRVRD